MKKLRADFRVCLQPFSAEFLYYSLLTKNINIAIHITVTLSVVFCGCETWSLILREKHGLGVLEKRVLKLRPKWEEAAGDWGKII